MITENKEDLNKIKNFYSVCVLLFQNWKFLLCTTKGKLYNCRHVELVYHSYNQTKNKITCLISLHVFFLISDFFTGCCLERKSSKINIQRSGKTPKSQIFYIVLKRNENALLNSNFMFLYSNCLTNW